MFKMPKIYYNPVSGPCRAVMLTAKAINLEFSEIINVDILKREQMTPSFLEKNPFHTVPTIEESDNWTIYDSHSIMPYLVEKYAEDDKLYPKDLHKRAIVDQRLHFDSNVLNCLLRDCMKSVMFQGAKSIPRDKENAFVEAYSMLETLLEKSKFVAGNNLTVADYSLVVSVACCNVWVPIASNRYPKLLEWLDEIAKQPFFNEVMEPGQGIYAGLVRSKLVAKK